MINIREKITAKKFDAIISLGADCLPALTFKTLGLADRYKLVWLGAWGFSFQ